MCRCHQGPKSHPRGGRPGGLPSTMAPRSGRTICVAQEPVATSSPTHLSQHRVQASALSSSPGAATPRPATLGEPGVRRTSRLLRTCGPVCRPRPSRAAPVHRPRALPRGAETTTEAVAEEEEKSTGVAGHPLPRVPVGAGPTTETRRAASGAVAVGGRRTTWTTAPAVLGAAGPKGPGPLPAWGPGHPWADPTASESRLAGRNHHHRRRVGQ